MSSIIRLSRLDFQSKVLYGIALALVTQALVLTMLTVTLAASSSESIVFSAAVVVLWCVVGVVMFLPVILFVGDSLRLLLSAGGQSMKDRERSTVVLLSSVLPILVLCFSESFDKNFFETSFLLSLPFWLMLLVSLGMGSMKAAQVETLPPLGDF